MVITWMGDRFVFCFVRRLWAISSQSEYFPESVRSRSLSDETINRVYSPVRIPMRKKIAYVR